MAQDFNLPEDLNELVREAEVHVQSAVDAKAAAADADTRVRAARELTAAQCAKTLRIFDAYLDPNAVPPTVFVTPAPGAADPSTVGYYNAPDGGVNSAPVGDDLVPTQSGTPVIAPQPAGPVAADGEHGGQTQDALASDDPAVADPAPSANPTAPPTETGEHPPVTSPPHEPVAQAEPAPNEVGGADVTFQGVDVVGDRAEGSPALTEGENAAGGDGSEPAAASEPVSRLGGTPVGGVSIGGDVITPGKVEDNG